MANLSIKTQNRTGETAKRESAYHAPPQEISRTGKITLLLKKRHRLNKSAKSKPPQKGMAKKKRRQNLDNQSFDTLISTRSRI